jgi:hypothetical protein
LILSEIRRLWKFAQSGGRNGQRGPEGNCPAFKAPFDITHRIAQKAKQAASDLPTSWPILLPPDQPSANTGAPIPVLSLPNKAVLERLYTREQVSVREIFCLAGATWSGVLNALDLFSISRDLDRRERTGHVPFGFDFLNHQ